MTPNSIGAAALGYTGVRAMRAEATGPMTRFGREVPLTQNTERKPVTPQRP